MRKFFLGAALVAASFGMAQSADAATVMDVDALLKPTCGTHQRQTLPSEKACL